MHFPNLRHLKADLEEVQPDVFVSVPLMLFSLQDKVREGQGECSSSVVGCVDAHHQPADACTQALRAMDKMGQPRQGVVTRLLEASVRYVRAQRVLQARPFCVTLLPPAARASRTGLAFLQGTALEHAFEPPTVAQHAAATAVATALAPLHR